MAVGVLAVWPTALLLLPAPSEAQDVERRPAVEGHIVEQGTQVPIPGAWVRIVSADGEETLAAGSTEVDGRFHLPLHPEVAAHPGAVVLEAGTLGYQVGLSDPFHLDPDDVVTVPTLELEPSPFALDTIRVQTERRQQFEIPPRERVLNRQLQGRGTFLAGASVARLPERRMDWALANRVEEFVIDPLRGLRVERTASNPDGCVGFMLNQWPVSRQEFLNEPRTNIGALEVYPEFDDIPQDLRFHVLNDMGSNRCGLVNAWTWHEWNRGIDGGG